MESLVPFHVQKSGTEIIPSCLLIPSQLKESTHTGGIKSVPFRILSRPISHINCPLVHRFDELNLLS